MTLTLYTTPLSANGRKVLAVARHLGLEPEVREVDVYRGEGRSAEYLAVNPTGRIPTLVDRELTLGESNAILLYLVERHGEGRLYASAPHQRAAIASWLFWEAAHWQPALIAVLAPLVGHRLRPDAVPAPAAPPDWQDARLVPELRHLESQLREREHLCGELSIADFSVAGMTTYFRAAGFPFADWPGIAAWHARIEALPAWRASATVLWG